MYHFFKNNQANKYFVYFLLLSLFCSGPFAYSTELFKNYVEIKLGSTPNKYVGNAETIPNTSLRNVESELPSKSTIKNSIDRKNSTLDNAISFAVYNSDLKEGNIGIYKKGDFDFIYDNIFKVNINENDFAGKEIYLSYDIKGIDKTTLPSKSVNFNKVVGGYVVKFSNEWQNVQEKINAAWLKNGLNSIYFTLPNDALYSYKIKNLKIFVKEKSVNHLIELKNLIGYKNTDKNIYLNGYINLPSQIENSGYTLSANDKPVKIVENQFEDKITNVDNKDVVLKLFKNNVLVDIIEVKAAQFIKADRTYDLEPLDSKNTVTPNVVVAKNYALYEDKIHSIEELRNIDIPQFESSFINVTKNKTAYRVANLKVKDSTAFKLFMEYDSLLIPNGYTEKDIQTFHFDTDYKKWIPVEKDSLIESKNVVVALSNKEGDYVNGIIQVPESPQTSSFTPTMMSDIKAADPSSEMTIISPPEVSQRGDANISYPIKIPSGRNGMQPNVSISYNSDGGNGWLGEGWGISTPAITIDTKWGIPTFDSLNESEIYNLNGEQLMYPKSSNGQDWMPNRHQEIGGIYDTPSQERGIAEKQFTLRKQGSFTKIERKGQNPSNYYWKVTSTDGTISWYGGKTGIVSNTVIKNAQDNIVHWALYMVEDVHGNNMIYDYDNYDLTGQTLDNVNLNGGKIFQIKNIYYTGFNGSVGNYKVEFVPTTTLRANPSINAKNGVKQVDVFLLDKIKVSNNNQLIRSYKFLFAQGRFNKSLLEYIVENDKNEVEFYRHKFEYYDDLKPDERKSDAIFDEPVSINLPSLESPTPSFSLGYGLLGASRINTTQTIEGGWEISPAIGLEIRFGGISQKPYKTLMFSLPFGMSYPRSRGIISMADMDGNGIDDIIYKHSDGLSYRPGNINVITNQISYGNVISISGIDAFYRGSGKTQNKFLQSWAIDFSPPFFKSKFHIGSRKFVSKNYTDIYITDGNGDGLMDIVKNEQVVFNEGLNSNGYNNFSTSSASTPNMLITAESDIIPGVPVRDEITDESGYESVRVWVAPKAGIIKINDTITLDLINSLTEAKYTIETSKSTINNGIPFRLYYKKLSVSDVNEPLEILNYGGSEFPLGSNNNGVLEVERGQRIYFRLIYNKDVDNGIVNSNPIIQYLNPINPTLFLKDENQIDHLVNDHQNAYLLNDTQLCSIPSSGNVKIEWEPISINSISDDVTYKIIQVTETNNGQPEQEVVVYQKSIPNNLANNISISPQDNDAGGDVSLPFHVDVCTYTNETKPACNVSFKFEVYSDSNQKWTEIQWKPKLTFTPDVVTSTIYTTVKYPIANHSVYKSTFVKKMAPVSGWVTSSLDKTYGLIPKTSINIGSSENGIFYMIVKRNGLLVGKTQLSIVDGNVYYDNNPILFEPAININNSSSQFEYTVGFYTDNKEDSDVINKYLLATNNMPVLVGYDFTLPENSSSYLPIQVDNCFNSLQHFGTMYKEWGQFFYNDDFDSSTTIPFDIHGKLLNKDLIDKNYNINEDTFGTFSECDQFQCEGCTDAYVECTSNAALNASNIENTDIDSVSETPNDPLFNEINPAFLVAIPTRDYVSNIEEEKWNGIFNTQFSSPTKFKSGSFIGSAYDVIFPDEESTDDVLIQANLQTGMPAITKLHESVSISKNKGWANSNIGIDATISKSESRYSEEVYNFMDINGDSYPEILSSNHIKYTNKRGGFLNSVQHNFGVINSSKNVGHRLSSNSAGSALGRLRIGKGGKSTDRGNAFSFIGMSLPIDVNFYNNNRENLFWIDLNGDGLSDQVKEYNGEILFNLSTGSLNNFNFTKFSLLREGDTKPNLLSISLGASVNMNELFPKLPLNVNIYAGYSNQGNTTKTTFVDITGDGLVDLLNVNNNEGTFNINTGNGFSSQQIDLKYIAENKITLDSDNNTSAVSIGGDVGKFFTLFSYLKWPKFLRIFNIKAGLTVSGSANLSLSHANKTFKDFNGDGFVDYVERDGNNLKVYYSRIKRTNKLQTVTNPLGGTFTIDYKVQPVTFNNPHAKWAMSSVIVRDGYNKVNDGEDIYRKDFVYENGKYDRREREFYGYEKVKVLDYNTFTAGSTDIYRTSVSVYNNSSYFLNGLPIENYIIKGSDENQKYNRTVNTYKIYTLNATNDEIQLNDEKPLTYDVGGKEGRHSAAVLLTKTRSEVYELNPSPGLVTEIEFTYDIKGRIIEYLNKGDINNTTDDYKSVITYHEIPSLNIITIPSSIRVLVNSVEMRKRTTELNTSNGNIIKVSALNGSLYADTEMQYDVYGNLTYIKYPKNSNGEAMSYTYTYDSTYNKYVEKVKDNAFGYESFTAYDINLDKPIEVTDIAGNKSKYFYDDFGRTTKVVGPKEIAANLDYTIKFEYFPYLNLLPSDANASAANFMPVALTKHFDVQHPDNDIETFTFIDGFGRPVQVKKDIELSSGIEMSRNYSEALTVSGKTKFDKFARSIEAFQPWWEEKTPATKFIINEHIITISSKVEYDELDRAIKSIDEVNNESTVQFAIAPDVDGINCLRTTSDVDQNGTQHIISETYHDVTGKLLSTKNVGGLTGSIWTKYQYNAIGELLSYTDTENISTSYKYDMFGRKVEVNHPDNGKILYEYDNVNLVSLQTQKLIYDSKSINYEYNYNRLTNVVYPNTPFGENLSNVKYIYGNAGNEKGRIVEIYDATGKQEFKYGVMGETIEARRTIVAPNLPTRVFATQFEYDSFNRIQRLTYPDGETVNYKYNRGGNLNKMTTQLDGDDYDYIKEIDYDYFEQKIYMKYGNNTETRYEYSPELRRMQNLNVKASDGQSMFNNTYSYDKVGNITNIDNDAVFNTTNYLGGYYNNEYTYDNLNRLTNATGLFSVYVTRGNGNNKRNFNLEMSYNDTHGIIQKKQVHTTQGYIPVYENTYTNDYVYETNTHKAVSITNSETGVVEEFKYDGNGNMIMHANSDVTRELLWDESNRLRVVNDNNQLQHYIYDAAGERTLKASSQIESVYENGQVDASSTTIGLYTTYVSPYMVVGADQRYSKHYFNGSERIVSKMGEQDVSIFEEALLIEPATQNLQRQTETSTNQNNEEEVDFEAIRNLQITDFNHYLTQNTNNVIGKKATTKNVKIKYEAYKKTSNTTEQRNDNDETLRPIPARPAAEIYYYHSDHLGSGTFLSDFNGVPYQFFLNLPFGETMIEQHSYSGDYTNRYKFNGKELDEETGFYYYGARYYNPKFSLMLSVDQMSQKYPGVNPYAYCFQNPINLIDPTGMEPDDPSGGDPPKGIKTTIYDKNGNITNTLPEQVVNMFCEEYGMDVKYENGVLSKVGESQTGSQISGTAKECWNNIFSNDSSKNPNLVFGEEMIYDSHILFGKTMSSPIGYGLFDSQSNTLFIDLADFNGQNPIGKWAETTASDFNSRAFNLSRVVEHELFGHGVKGLKHENGSSANTDSTILFMNIIENEIGNYHRLDYMPGVIRFSNKDGSLRNAFIPDESIGKGNNKIKF